MQFDQYVSCRAVEGEFPSRIRGHEPRKEVIAKVFDQQQTVVIVRMINLGRAEATARQMRGDMTEGSHVFSAFRWGVHQDGPRAIRFAQPVIPPVGGIACQQLAGGFGPARGLQKPLINAARLVICATPPASRPNRRRTILRSACGCLLRCRGSG